jgi:hypothetical protein
MTRRTRSGSLGAPCPALRPGRVLPVAFPLADPLPSTASATTQGRRCLAASQVLRDRQTSHARSSQACGLGLPWAVHPPITSGRTNRGISRFSRMEIPRMHRFFDPAGPVGGSRVAPPAVLPSAYCESVGTPHLAVISGLNSPACVPLSTLRLRPCGRRRMTRGHRGSLVLRCGALSSPSPCRFIPAYRNAPAVHSPHSLGQ